MMKNVFTALKNGTWEEYKETFKEKMKASEWAFDRTKKGVRLGSKVESQCRTCAQTAKVSLWKTTFCGSLWEKPQGGGAQFVEKSTTGGNRTIFWSCKLVKVFKWAKVFKAHAIPQGLCEKLINALKLLANQQEDEDGLLQNIVTNLGKRSRKGLTDGLRDFIKVDNHRALDVGEPHRGTGTPKVRKPKVLEGGSDVTIRACRDELRLRAEEVNTSKAYTDVDHIKPERWAWRGHDSGSRARPCLSPVLVTTGGLLFGDMYRDICGDTGALLLGTASHKRQVFDREYG